MKTGIEGSTLGRYELRRRIARGGMAEVYLGYDRRVRRRVAVKVLYGSDEPFVRRFEREAEAVGTLSHDHILPLYDFGEQRPWYYLVMPYVEGGTLRDYLLQRTSLTLEEAGSFLEQIAEALQYAHDHGVVHRDVKPSNILLRPDGHAYLGDFGLAKAKMGADAVTHAGTMVGTPEYMAPEQSNGIHDYRSDIYSLGIILYQMLTGRVPFTGDTPVAISLKHIQAAPMPPGELNSAISQAVEDVILKALVKDPNERYQQAKILADAYWEALKHEPNSVQEKESAAASEAKEQLDTNRVYHEERLDTDKTRHEEHDKTLYKEQLDTDKTLHKEKSYAATLILDTDAQPVPRITKPLRFPLQNEQPIHVHSNKKRAFFLLICVLCVGLILGSAIPLTQFWRSHTMASNSRPHTSLSLLQHRATATAIKQIQAQDTLAAQSRVRATAGITTAIGAGNVLYSNSMTSADGGWIDDGSQCYFSGEGYHVYSAFAHAMAWCYYGQQSFSNMIITAQATLLRGDIYGLVFRLSPLSKSFYALELNSHGAYRFVMAQGSNPLNWLTLIDWTRSTAIHSGYNHTNTFLILATGSHFRFYINKQLIVPSFSDTNYVSGLIGFLTGGDSGNGTEAIFNTVWVFQK
jgi:serine/threonine protein kinase